VTAITLLRVIQEGCNNAIKYANAKKVIVKICYEPKKLILSIADDGDGFDCESVSDSVRDDNSGFGLSIMKERVFLLSGTIDIQSKPGVGCNIVVKIPT
jgi:two-component system sensor histidine kinase DegS